MSARSYELGWRVFRDRFDTDVPPDRRRRAVRVGAVVALTAAITLVVVGLLVGWPDLGSVAGWIGALMLAVGIGAFAVVAVPLAPRQADASRLSWSGSVMQAPERTERHFRARTAPTIPARDRDEVLRDAELVLSGQVRDVFGGLVVVGSGTLVAISLVVLDTSVRIVGFVSVILIVRVVVGIVRLGRVERARALAEALPADAPDAHGTVRRRSSSSDGRSPRGTKLGLPGE